MIEPFSQIVRWVSNNLKYTVTWQFLTEHNWNNLQETSHIHILTRLAILFHETNN